MLYDSEAAHKGTYHLKTKEPIVEGLMECVVKEECVGANARDVLQV